MRKLNRRTVMAAGTTLAAGGLFGTTSAAADEHGESDEKSIADTSNGWSSYYGTVGNTGSVPGDGAFPEPETLAWEHEDSGHVAVADGRVYLRSGAEVHALDDSDGSVVWTSDELGAEGGVEYGSPAVADETVVVGGDRLTALDTNRGDVLWSRKFDTEGGEAVTSPTVAFDTVFVVGDETLHAFNLADGSLRWSRETVERDPPEDPEGVEWDGSREVTFVSTPAAVANKFVYAGVGHDDCPGFAAFDVLTGETQWTYTVDKPPYPQYDYHDYILATEDRIFTGSRAEGAPFPVLDAQTGEEVARTGHWFRSAVTDEVQVRVSRPEFSVQNYNTGDEWEKTGGTDAWRRPAIAGETLIIPLAPWGTESGVYGFDLEDGTEQWRFTHPDVDMEDVSSEHGFVVSGETIYVTGGDRLQVLRPDTDEETPDEEEPEDQSIEEDSPLELSVSAPDSIARGETASVDVSVWNHGDDPTEVTVTLEIGEVSESSTVEIAAGECYASFHSVSCADLSVGDNEWTVTANGESESGVLTLTE